MFSSNDFNPFWAHHDDVTPPFITLDPSQFRVGPVLTQGGVIHPPAERKGPTPEDVAYLADMLSGRPSARHRTR